MEQSLRNVRVPLERLYKPCVLNQLIAPRQPYSPCSLLPVRDHREDSSLVKVSTCPPTSDWPRSRRLVAHPCHSHLASGGTPGRANHRLRKKCTRKLHRWPSNCKWILRSRIG